MVQLHGYALKFAAISDSDEDFLWVGKPEVLPYLGRGASLIFAGLFTLVLMILFINWYLHSVAATGNPPEPAEKWMLLIFASPLLIITLMSALNLVRLLISYRQTWYAITNKRVIIRSGFWGAEFFAYDYDKIPELQVTVSFLEGMTGTGTISGFELPRPVPRNGFDSYTASFTQTYDRFVSIRDPYRVFRMLKETSVDVKTDWEYPNALRPEENPGYRTKYAPRK
jgi:hypothetical protein